MKWKYKKDVSLISIIHRDTTEMQDVRNKWGDTIRLALNV